MASAIVRELSGLVKVSHTLCASPFAPFGAALAAPRPDGRHGSALMLAPVAAWIALRGDLKWPPVLLGLAVLFWVTGFDIIYACQDVAFDRAHGLHSIPQRLGVKNALRVALASHVVMVACLVALGLSVPLGRVYFIGVAGLALLLTYEHAIVRPDDLSR